MTTIAPARARVAPTAGGTLTGTGALVGLALRRDRIRLPVWLVAITVFVPYFHNVLAATAPARGGLRSFAGLVDNPMIRAFTGPVFGFAEVTLQRAFLVYTIEFLLAAAVLNILLVARHTRAEEQTGRAELVRATVIGRHAPLTAALAVAVTANLALGLLIAAAMLGLGFPVGGALLFGSGVAATGLAFAGITAFTVQLTEHSRGAAGLAVVALGAAWTLRAAGAMQAAEGGPLTWLSPLGWAQLTRVLADERWWPLALSLAFATATAAAGYALAARRDLGAGLLAQRPGRAAATPWLRSPFTMTLRLQRTALLWWAVALLVIGFVWGNLAGAMRAGTAQSLLGDGPDITRAYLSLMVLFTAYFVGAFAILAVVRLRTEETRGRAAPVLATSVGRWAWLGSTLAATTLAVVALLTVMGLATGVGAAIGVGDGALVGELLVSALVRAPEMLLLMALAAALYAVAPRWTWVSWGVLVLGGIARFWGPSLGWPAWLLDLSPFNHVPRMPLQDFALTPVLVLTGIAAVLAAVALVAFRRRDLDG